jgi:hypothetical protein
MQEVVERLRAVVAAFDPKRKDLQIERIEQLSQAIADCRRWAEENEKTDHGCSQRLAREVDEVLSELPTFRHLGNKQDMAARHTRKLAEDHLADIQKQLDELIESDKKAKARDLREWVNHHPVFGKLRKSCIKKGLPKDSFVLLFEKTADGELELMPRSVEENQVLTRFRPVTFIDDSRVHSMFENKKQIVGAALIGDNKLIDVVGEVPPPTDNRDQLHILLFHSNEVASGPAKQFVEANNVLNQLHSLARSKQIPKDAYVLLFRMAPDAVAENNGAEEQEEREEPQVAEEAPVEETPVAEEAPVEEAPVGAAEEAPAEETPVAEEAPAEEAPVAEEAPAEDAPIAEQAPAEEATEEAPQTEPQPEPEAEPAPQQQNVPLEIVDKTTADGKVITRFWSNDFVRKHHLFDMFRDAPPVVGAAVIREKELLHAIGLLPQPRGKQPQLEAVLQASNKAVQRPAFEWVAANEVLNALNQLANGPAAQKPGYVLLFSRTATSPYSLVSGKFGPRMPLEEFKSARILHQRFSNQDAITGAAVIEEGGSKPFVSAAYGRTPLKQSMLAVPENFTRLGLPAEIAAPPRRPHSGDKKPQRRSKQRQS